MIKDQDLEASHLDSRRIEESLSQIFRSSRFKDSLQLQALLRYIVDGSVRGNDETLKERVIGIEVFRRRPDYDTTSDPIVRSRIGTLRKRLGEYYESPEARTCPIQIVIPPGSYRATLALRPELADVPPSQATERTVAGVPQPSSAVQSAPDVGTSVPELQKPAGSRRVWTAGALVFIALLVTAAVILREHARSELYLFWKPLLDSDKNVMIYNGSISPIYLPKSESGNATREQPASAASEDAAGNIPSKAGAFVSYAGGVVPTGDIDADLKVAAVMNKYDHNLRPRSGSNLLFLDLKGSPAVLIGAYDNHWTMNINRDLPFFFDNVVGIREREGKHRVWSSSARTDNALTDDYAVIFRLLNSKTSAPLVGIAGLTTCGTQAAAEFVTDATQMEKLSSMDRDLQEQKNIEFVLHASLLNCTPASIDIIAQRAW
jgi:hypothetical protein